MKKKLITVIMLAVSLTLISCAEELNKNQSQQKLKSIDVAEVLVKQVQTWRTYTTHLESPEQVALMPRVSGVIEYIAFNEGDKVKKGELLFKVDDRLFITVVANLEAQIISAEAALEQAKNEAKRAIRLIDQKAISTEQAEARHSILRQHEAQLSALQAQLEAAELDLEFTAIRSPIDGVISRANITKGNYILAGKSVLTSILSNQAMYAYFDIDERTWNSLFADVTAASKQQVIMQKLGENGFLYDGYINFIDNKINPATGTLRVRAIFNRVDTELRAGSFARIKLAADNISKKVLVPDRAIATDLKNRFALTMDKNNELQYKQVEVGERYGRLRVITSGLQQGDVIAVNGAARARAGMLIAPNMVDIDSTGIAFRLSSLDNTTLITAQ